jgi:hypothetical protein
MESDSLSFTLIGAERDGEAVLMNDFSQYLELFATCLKRVERRTTIAGKPLRNLIAGLQTGSATVTIRPVSPKDRPALGHEVYETFKATVHALETGGRIDQRFTNDDLKSFRELAKPIWSGKKKVTVAGVELTTRYLSNIDTLLRGETKSKGTVKGRIERLNVHERHEFTLYPPIAGYSVQCIFPDELFETVHQAIKRTITVSGMMYYKRDNPYPERVQVESIEIHPDDKDLPTGRSLRGTMPNATEGKTTTEFVTALRNGK